MWEGAFALLTAMAQLGVYTAELNVLRTSTCPTFGGTYAFAPKFCDEMASAFLGPLTADSAEASTRGWVLTLKQLLRAHASSQSICFEQLLAGGLFNMFDAEALNAGREGLLALYRYRVLRWHGLSPLATSPGAPQTRILLVNKSGVRAYNGRLRRGIVNFPEVHEHVRARFDTVADVRVTGFAGMPLAEQLQLITSTSVCFSPGGGVSLLLPFLPRGAHAILVNYIIRTLDSHYAGEHGECSNCSSTMEAEMWRHVRYVRKLYYRIRDASDVPVPPLTAAAGRAGNGGPDGYEAQRGASVHINVHRLGKLVQTALAEQAELRSSLR